MDGIKFLMSQIPSSFQRQLQESHIGRNLKLLPVRTCILTGGALILANIDNAHESFSGDIKAQLIGSTVCALAYERHSGMAVELFAECLMPQIL